jgi:hypothetical protein
MGAARHVTHLLDTPSWSVVSVVTRSAETHQRKEGGEGNGDLSLP